MYPCAEADTLFFYKLKRHTTITHAHHAHLNTHTQTFIHIDTFSVRLGVCRFSKSASTQTSMYLNTIETLRRHVVVDPLVTSRKGYCVLLAVWCCVCVCSTSPEQGRRRQKQECHSPFVDSPRGSKNHNYTHTHTLARNVHATKEKDR